MIKVTRTTAKDTYDSITGVHNAIKPALYINISGFKDEEEQEIILSKINRLISEWQTKRRVF